MIKILVVDDEKIERNGIRFLLKQMEITVEMFEAANGVKALELLEQQKVDLLLTDIKMPFMDGMTLIQNVADRHKEIKMIIFSGYGEFEYAKQAMKYGVSNYILKPVDPKEFESTMKKVLKEIEEEKAERELQEEGIQFVREHILLSLINGAELKDVLGKLEKHVSVDFLEQYHCMMLLEFDREFFGRRDAEFQQQILGGSEVLYLNLNQQQCILLFEHNIEIDWRNFARKLQVEIEQTYHEACYIAVSEYTEEALDLAASYETLETLMENKFYQPESRVFWENEERTDGEEADLEDDMLMRQIRRDIKVKDMVGLREHFNLLCDKYRGKKTLSQMYVKFVFSNLMKEMYDVLPQKDRAGFNMVVDRLYRANDFSEVMDILQDGIRQLEEAFAVNPQMVHREIETVKQYIYSNYDKELSVDMLAEQVYLAPSYLSHIFKKETGQNLSKFIKSLRMEKAKEMLIESHLKIVNISYSVGYPNVSYFCQSFREYFGVSPQKFRNRGKEMKSIRKRFCDAKLRRKLMGIYLCIGTIPILLLGFFAYFQQRTALMEKEQQNITDVLSQGVSRFNSQMLIYENLSDYIAFNSPVSNVLLGEYGTIYEMYEQYRDYVDPVLSSVKYFSPNIMKFTIYVDKDITAHDTTVAPIRDIEQEKWYQESDLDQTISWKVDVEEKKAFCFRTMPILAQSGSRGILYLEVSYKELFAGFDEIFQNDYGLRVYDEQNHSVYQSGHFDSGNMRYLLSEQKLLSEYERVQKGRTSKYTIVSSSMGVKGWKVLLYRPDQIVAEAGRNLIVITIGIIAACILVSMLASVVFSRLVVRDIEKLQQNMKSVEEGDMTILVTSDAKDEIGDLIRGFGSMIEKINHLIHEVYEGKLLQKQYEMRALQAQINPHFLYNSLSLINWKALEAGKEDISKLTLALSSFYRTSLNRGNNVLTIKQELENMNSYLEIQSCMHDNSFDVILDIQKEILTYRTLNLLLQPLVENAIEHGIDLLEDRRGVIRITGRMDEEKIYLYVEDNGVGIEPELLASILEFKTRGYGVRNVNERIKLFYGEEYKLQIESKVGEGTRTIITIPRGV